MLVAPLTLKRSLKQSCELQAVFKKVILKWRKIKLNHINLILSTELDTLIKQFKQSEKMSFHQPLDRGLRRWTCRWASESWSGRRCNSPEVRRRHRSRNSSPRSWSPPSFCIWRSTFDFWSRRRGFFSNPFWRCESQILCNVDFQSKWKSLKERMRRSNFCQQQIYRKESLKLETLKLILEKKLIGKKKNC